MEFERLDQCADSLKELTIQGSDWESLDFSKHTYPKVRKLSIHSDTLQSIHFGSNSFNALSSLSVSSQKLTTFSVLDNSLNTLPSLTLNGTLPAFPLFPAHSFTEFRVGNSSLTHCSFSMSTKPLQRIEIGAYSFHDSPSFLLGPLASSFSHQRKARNRCTLAHTRSKTPIPSRFPSPPPAPFPSTPRRSAR